MIIYPGRRFSCPGFFYNLLLMNKVTVENAPLSWRHIWIVAVASMGQMIGTAVATIVSVIIPMIQIVGHPELASWQQGLLGATDLIGIAVGATILGKLSNKYGYLRFFRICPAIVLLASLVSIFVPDIIVTFIALFFIGFAIGGEYSLDSDYVSELMPQKWRSAMVGVTKAASALGNIIVAGVAYLLIMHWQRADCWPRLMWLMVIFSGLMIISRIWFAPSPKWMLEHGRRDEAERAVRFFLGPDVELPPVSDSAADKHTPKGDVSMSAFLRGNVKQIVLTGIPWACEGLGVYGIGVFLPILVLALGIINTGGHSVGIMHVASSVEITFWISCIILPGFVLGLLLIRRMRSTTQLAWGFYLSALMMLILLLAFHFKWPAWISVTAFMGFELFLNIGPHLITYVLPTQVYPVSVRSLGSGIAASLGKIGAVLAVFFIPIILRSGGAVAVLGVSAGVMLLGGVVTSVFAPMVMKKSR